MNTLFRKVLTAFNVFRVQVMLAMDSAFHKYAHKLESWWNITNVPPETHRLHKMLSSAFGCFAIALFLLILLDPKNQDSTYLFWLSLISLLLAFVLLLAIPLSSRCQIFYTCARLLDGKFIIIWVFMFSPIIALKRLLDILTNVLNNAIPEAYKLSITSMLVSSGIFFIVYFSSIQ